MSGEKSVLLTLCIFLVAQMVLCITVSHEDLVCVLDRLDARYLGLENMNRALCGSPFIIFPSTIVWNVVSSRTGRPIDTGSVDLVKIDGYENRNSIRNSMHFIPAGIKNKFPKMSALEIYNTAVLHLEREDMRQFGDDLTLVRFLKGSLTALGPDVFEFNRNLRFVHFLFLQFTFIDPLFFENFKTMRLRIVTFQDCRCIDQYTEHPATERWHFGQCNDFSSRMYNQNRINMRRDFFSVIFS